MIPKTPSGYIIMTAPLAAPPEGDGTRRFSEPVRWYWAGRRRWTSRKEDARVFKNAGDAVSQIGELRRALSVEFVLEPLLGSSFDVPVRRKMAAEQERKPPHETH